jgi:hypothetical protein
VTTSDPQPDDGPLALPRRHERRQIEKDVPATRPTKDAQAITVFMKGAQRVELDDHAATVVTKRPLRPTRPAHDAFLDGFAPPDSRTNGSGWVDAGRLVIGAVVASPKARRGRKPVPPK